MIDLQTISIMIAATGLTIATIYYVLILRNQNQTRQAQLFMQLANQLYEKEFLSDGMELLEMQWEDFADFYRKYDSSVNRENYPKRFRNWYIYDSLGLLLKKGLIDREFAYYLTGGFIAPMLWKKFEPIIKHQRETRNNPELAVWYEYLSNEIMKMREQRGYTSEFPERPVVQIEE